MIVTNTTKEYTYVPGYTLTPGEAVIIPNEIYLGQTVLRDQINNLISQDRVHAFDPDGLIDIPTLDDDGKEIPGSSYVDEYSFEVHKEDSLALLGIEESDDDDSYGILELHSSTGGILKLKSYCLSNDEHWIYISKDVDEPGNLLCFEVNGNPVLVVTTDGKFAFGNVPPVSPPEVNPATVDAEGLANALISLGLLKES